MSDYIKDMEEKLKAARERVRKGKGIKAIKASAPLLMEIIDGEISLEINRGYNDNAPLSYDEYLESHGAVRGIRRIRNLMDAKEQDEIKAAQEVKEIEENIKLVKNEQKR